MNPTYSTITKTRIKPKNGFGYFNDEFEDSLNSRPIPSYEVNEPKTTQIPEVFVDAFKDSTPLEEGKLGGEKGTLFKFESRSVDFSQPHTLEFNKPVAEQKYSKQPITENLSAALGITASAASEVSKQTLKITSNVTKDTFSAVFDLLEIFTGKSLFKKKESKPNTPESPQQQDLVEKKFVQDRLQETETAKNQVSSSSAQELLKQALMIDVGPMNAGDAKGLNLSSSLSGEHLVNRYHLMNKARRMNEATNDQKRSEMNAGMNSRNPDLSLNKVGEGGSIMSSTGGAGAG